MKPYYEDDAVTIYHGDTLDVLPRLGVARPSVLVTDPDYVAAGGSSNGRTSETSYQYFTFWLTSTVSLIRSTMAPETLGFVFADWRTIGIVAAAFREEGSSTARRKSWACNQSLVWDRQGMGMGAPFRNSYEMIAVVAGPQSSWDHLPKNIPTVLRYTWHYGRHAHHGAEKPVGLVSRLLGWTPGDGVVLDPFMGSGTTLVAAKNLGRKAIGIEIEERYCEIAAQRCSQEVLAL